MPNNILSPQELDSRITQQLSAHGQDDTIPMTFANAIMESQRDALRVLLTTINQYYNRNILPLAHGNDLDDLVIEYGVERGVSSYVFDDSYSNFHVFIDNGTASDYTISKEDPLVIPSTAIEISDTNGHEYIANDDVIINPDSYTGYIPIVSITNKNDAAPIGTISTVLIDTGLVDNLDPTVADQIVFGCRNNKAVNASTTVNTDEGLRDAAILRINSMNNNNSYAIRLSMVELGITDLEFKRDMFGYGTLGVLVKVNNSSSISDTTIKRINNMLTNITPNTRVIVPEVMRVSFKFNVEFVNVANASTTKQAITDAISEYFSNNISAGTALVPDTITNLVNEVDNVSNASMRCLFIDGRRSINRRQIAMPDQVFELEETEAVIFTA